MYVPKLALPIETARLAIRPLRLADGDVRFILHGDPEFVEFIGTPIDRSTCDAQLASELSGAASMFSAAVCIKGNEEMIGEVLLLPSTVREVELVMAFLRQHRRSGYGLEVARATIEAAMKDPKIDTVIGCVEDTNGAAKRLVEALGMTPEGFMPRISKKPRRYVLRK